MELWRDTTEFQGKYQLLNVSNPALAFGKLKWIFCGRCFSQQRNRTPSTSLHPAFALQTQGDGESNCHSAVKCFIEIQNCVCAAHPHTLYFNLWFCTDISSARPLPWFVVFKVRTPVADGEQLIYYHTVALSLAGTVVSALPVGHLRPSEAALENLKIFQHDKAKNCSCPKRAAEVILCDWLNWPQDVPSKYNPGQ